jgi:hypothetical protein
MKLNEVVAEIEGMAQTPGVTACALVDIETGLVYAAAGEGGEIEALAEAASDYWRLYWRLQGKFASLGKLRALSAQHEHGALTILPCGAAKIVATRSERSGLDWTQWLQRVKQLERSTKDI